MLRLVAVLTLSLSLSLPSAGAEAWCATTDDGEYACTFERLDGSGSFRISAPGKPIFEVWIDAPGEATVGATFEPGGRSVPLPGPYLRSRADGACWVSAATGTEICAW